MSHFTVLIIGENPEKQLEPYHEFECTGIEKYVEEIDKTEYMRQQYEESTCTRIVDSEGGLHDPWDDKFWRKLNTGEKVLQNLGKLEAQTRDEYKSGEKITLIQDIPEGWEERELSTKAVQSFRDYVDGYYSSTFIGPNDTPDYEGDCRYGYNRLNEKGECIQVIHRTNPNAKWDWYRLGGRWTGFFKLKETTGVHAVGTPGLMTATAKPGRADQARRKDIDFAGMRELHIRDQLVIFDKVVEIVGDQPVIEFKDVLEKCNGDNEKAREVYWSNPIISELSEENLLPWRGTFKETYCNLDRAAFIEQSANQAISTFAVLKNGKWYEKGKMGWWAIVADEMTEAEWYAQFSKLLEETSGDTLLSVYDCHI